MSGLSTTMGAIFLGCVVSAAYVFWNCLFKFADWTVNAHWQTIGDDYRPDVPLFPLIPEGPAPNKAHGACFGHRSAAAIAQMRGPRRS
jgi:hypothetical protein